MPKKKAVLSGFSLLMKELQEKYAKEGRNIPMAKMKDFADPIWKSMTVEERALYNQRAKQSRGKSEAEKLASDGTLIQHNFELLEEEEIRERHMILSIREFVNGNEQDPDIFRNLAVQQPFFIMSFNILCCTDKDEYIPLEMAIIEYSIQNGISRHMHKFIHPGSVPVGYTGEAKRHSEDTHQIPFTGHEKSERDYKAIVEELRAFVTHKLSVDADYPPVFILREAMEQTAGCLYWLCRKAGVQNFLRVWDLSQLVMELRAGAVTNINDRFPSVLIAHDMLTKNTFDYSVNTRCEFHEDLDSAYCALGCVRRLCFLISDCLCSVFDVEVTENHLPTRAVETKPYEIHYPASVSYPKPTSQQGSTRVSCSSSLFDFDDDDDDLHKDSHVPSVRPLAPTSALEQLSLNPSAVAPPGQGIGRGRLRKL